MKSYATISFFELTFKNNGFRNFASGYRIFFLITSVSFGINKGLTLINLTTQNVIVLYFIIIIILLTVTKYLTTITE